VSGTVTFDPVTATYNAVTQTGTLDFTRPAKPVRNATVQVRQNGVAIATTVTDDAGQYTASFTSALVGTLEVAVLAQSQTPPIQVVDNTDGKAIWAASEPLATTGGTVNIHAQHGWTGTGYVAAQRRAAPFAILDAMYTAAHAFMAVRPVTFPSLEVNWSPSNVPQGGNPSAGLIGGTYYNPADNQIYVLGKAGIDTDEFDSHVIVHEWGHFLENNVSRADSPGGPHGFADVLDPRLALSEGWGDAVPAMVLPETMYADTYFPTATTLNAFGFDAETAPTPTDDPTPGPFSEMSIMRLLYDIYDSGSSEAYDTVATGLGPIYDVLAGPEKTTDALTTVASIVAGLEAQGVNGTALDTLMARYSIGPIANAFGAGDPDLSAIFTVVSSFPSSTPLSFDSTVAPNMRGQNQYFVFTGNGAQVTVHTTAIPDVDIAVYRRGQLLGEATSPSGNEKLSVPTVAGAVYVAVITGWGYMVGTYPVTVTLTSP
jgi:hypothetical protein